MTRAHARIVRSKKKHHRGDVRRIDACPYALRGQDVRFNFRGEPQPGLSRCAHGARHNTHHPYAESPQLAFERTGVGFGYVDKHHLGLPARRACLLSAS
jgi:hypothetical protein